MVILGAIWLAWQGLIRKRATRTIEGTVWMVIACAAAIWLIGAPGGLHRGRQGRSPTASPRRCNIAFAKLPRPSRAAASRCSKGDPQTH